MSDPDPIHPESEPPTPNRISDRAALEAALAGAAGLLLGRMLLGRGAGLLAGTAAIAARLLTDAAAKKPVQGESPVPPPTVPVQPPMVPASPLVPEPGPSNNSTSPILAPPAHALPLPGPVVKLATLAEPDLSANWAEANFPGFDDTPEAVEIVEVGEVAGQATLPQAENTAASPDASPDNVPTTRVEAAPTDDTPFLVEVFPEARPTPSLEPFANLFTEASPLQAAAPSTPVGEFPSGLGDASQLPPPPSTDSSEKSAAPPTSAWLPLPAFPTLPEAPAAKTSAEELPAFPDVGGDLPHPDEIWRMAAEESAPVPPPISETAVLTPPETTTHPYLQSRPLASAMPLFEAGQENPFAALLGAAAPSAPPAPGSISAPVALPEMRPLAVFPEVTSPQAPAPFIPASAPAAVIPENLADPVPILSEIQDPPADPPVLPIISLKIRPAPAAYEPAGPDAAHPPATPSVATEAIVTAHPGAGTVTPAAPVPGGPDMAPSASLPSRNAGKVGLALFLIVALMAIWHFREELKKVFVPLTVQSAPHNSSGPVKSLPAPAVPRPVAQPPLPAVPASPPVPRAPVVPGSPTPKVPEPPPPDPKAAMVRPPPTGDTPAAPASPLAEPVLFAEPPAGVPQDFAPDSPEGKARQTLEKLLTATALHEITPLIHDPTTALKQAAQWFPDGNPQPVSWKRIIFDSSDRVPRSAYKATLFRVVTDQAPLGFPVAVEETKNGPRIDFTAYIQCRDRLLDAYMAKPDSAPQPFLVLMRRGHYFGDDLSAAELEQLICLEITAPNPGSAKHRVFIQRGTDLGRWAVRRFVWDKSYTPVVELTRAGKQVEISAIVRDTWRSPTP